VASIFSSVAFAGVRTSELYVNIELLTVRNMNICIYISSRRIMAGAFKLLNFIIVGLPWFAIFWFVLSLFVYTRFFDFISARAYFIIRL
jgi:hypothetical protein